MEWKERKLASSLCFTIAMRRIQGNGICVCPCLHCIKTQNNIVKLQQVLLLSKASGKYMLHSKQSSTLAKRCKTLLAKRKVLLCGL